MKKKFKKTSGVTLIELLVGSGIFIIMMSIASATAFQLYQAKQKIERTNMLYTETRFVMDRLVREVQTNTIDYYEYFSHNLGNYSQDHDLNASGIEEYGKNPGLYEMFFKLIPNDDQSENDVSSSSFSWDSSNRSSDIDLGYFNTGADETSANDEELDSAAGTYSQSQLYLLSDDGLTKTIIKAVSDTVGSDTIGRIVLAQMTLTDTNADSVPDAWKPSTGFDNGSELLVFHAITPSYIDITDFTVIISPLDDPRKSFAESIKNDGENPHIQPHVIFRIGAKLSPKKFLGIPGENLEFSLQTSAVSRVLQNITFPRP